MEDIFIKLREEDVDVNDQDMFFGILIKGLVYDINDKLLVRGIPIDHFILNTGDDIMYLEKKGVDQSKEPLEQTNEDYIYNTIPRCIVTPSGINILTDQLTNPYTNGSFQIEDDDNIYQFHAEYRRMPIEMSVGLKYYFNSFSDVLECTQQICAKLAFINNFKVNYLGQTISSTYQIPESIDPEMNMEFDGLTTDSKYRSISLDLRVLSNIPVIKPKTIVPADCVVKEFKTNITV